MRTTQTGNDGRPYRVEVSRQAEKTLRRLPRNLLQRLRTTFQDLAKDPRPRGCVRLTGEDNLYRIRVGDWRVIYSIYDDRLLIVVIKVSPRGSAYQNL